MHTHTVAISWFSPNFYLAVYSISVSLQSLCVNVSAEENTSGVLIWHQAVPGNRCLGNQPPVFKLPDRECGMAANILPPLLVGPTEGEGGGTQAVSVDKKMELRSFTETLMYRKEEMGIL